MLVGVDLKKDPERCCTPHTTMRAGVTAAFNLNVLHRINRELAGRFRPRRASSTARITTRTPGRIEMHLVSTRDQAVTVAGRRFRFSAGETIHTENSYKYSVDEFQALARQAGFEPVHCWIDNEGLFSIHYLTVPG